MAVQHGRIWTNRDYYNYCNRVGMGTGWGQCAMTNYYEEMRTKEDPHWEAPLSNIDFNCNSVGNDLVTKSHSFTRTATSTIGLTTTLTVGATFQQAPLGAGASETVSFSVAASFQYSWGTSEDDGEADTVTVPPGYMGWIGWSTYHGVSHGIGTMMIVGAPRLDVTENGQPFPKPLAEIKIPMDISGSLPMPADPQLAQLAGKP
ncbi:hypothetical protein AB0N17_46630, partial [Streptomyces sp. NPDC051133]